jgi:hypothetical protein
MLRKRTIWASDLDIFEEFGQDPLRWCFKGGKGGSPPPPPPPEPRDDRRPDNSKSKGIEEAARTRNRMRKKGSRGGLKIEMGKGVGANIPGKK